MGTKFTFKRVQHDAWSAPEYDIKLNRKVCGTIIDRNGTKFIRLMVYKQDINSDGNPNCPWQWRSLMQPFTTYADAQRFLNINFESITRTFNLHLSEQ